MKNEGSVATATRTPTPTAIGTTPHRRPGPPKINTRTPINTNVNPIA
jgi:hypothetical protein